MSEPSLRNSDVLSLVARRVESDRPLALRRIDRAAKGARARAAPGTSRVRHLRRDRRRGKSAPRPRRRRGAPATARRRPRWLHRRKLRDEERAVVVDRGAFAQRLATSLLRFEELTAHQRRALVQTRGARAVLLTAPAGGGKTFVAIARAVEALDEGGYVVFAARAPRRSCCFSASG